MLASSQNIAPKPAALPPAVHATLPASGSAGGPSFAQFLSDQPTLAPPEPSDAEPSDAESASSEPAAPTAAAPRRPTSTAKPVQSRAPDAATPAKSEPATTKGEEAGDAKITATDPAQQDDPETSGLAEFTQLIGLTPQPQAVPVAALPAGVPGAETMAGESPAGKRAARGRIDGAAEEEVTPAAGRSSGGADTAAVTERRPTDAPARDAAARAKGVDLAGAGKAAALSASSSETLQTASTPGGAATAPQAAAAPAALPTSFAAALAQAMPTTPAAADVASVSANGQVHAALHSSAFAPELGARVSLLAVDGVQQAELQLNPADMGPVTVQIVVDGAQAQVSFHAVQAETRQALEQSLPDLAAALQGQGLTLSGGGVFQQASRDPQDGHAEAGRDEDGRGSRSGGAARVGSSTAVAAPPVRRSVGLLDTFA